MTRGKHEPLVITIRRPRARVTLTRSDGELMMAALADAAGYLEWRASQWCAMCDAAPEGACEDHLHDAALAGAYRTLAARLAEVLPAPRRRGPVSAWADVSRAAPAGGIVKVRLSGTRRGCAEVTARLHQVLYVASVSEPYPEAGSSRLVRVYVRVRLDLAPAPPPAAATGDPQ